jgi:hypothetical protein
MPKPATLETSDSASQHLVDYVLMRNRLTGEERRVPAKAEAIVPLMTNGWSQIDAPATKEAA